MNNNKNYINIDKLQGSIESLEVYVEPVTKYEEYEFEKVSEKTKEPSSFVFLAISIPP